MENRPLILVTDRFDYSLENLFNQIEEADCRYQKDLFDDEALLAKARVLIIRTTTKIDEKLLKKARSLQFVITSTSGFDHIDLKATAQRGVRCFHISEAHGDSVAEFTFLLILAVCRRFSLACTQIEKGAWNKQFLLGQELRGQSLGIIGLGRVGSRVARIAGAFGMKVSAFDPYVQEVQPGVTMLGFEELMRSSDIVTLHVPKTKKTFHMIKKESLQWMGPESRLVNMSRGDVVNQRDLIEHLGENPLFGVGLDVFQKEPLPVSSPLLKFPNVVLTPHIGGSTSRSLEKSSRLALEKALALLKGKVTNGELPPKTSWYENGNELSYINPV